MNDFKLWKSVRQKLEQGKSHQETMDEVLIEYPDEKVLRVADVVKKYPSLLVREKMKKWNYLFWGLCCLVFGLRIYGEILSMVQDGVSLFSILGIVLFSIIGIILVWGIIRYSLQIYQLSSMFMLLYVWGIIGRVFNNTLSLWMIIFLIFTLLAIILGFWLGYKQKSKYKISREEYINQEGNRRLRYVVTFEE